MNKEQMEALWSGPLQSALKKARFTRVGEFGYVKEVV